MGTVPRFANEGFAAVLAAAREAEEACGLLIGDEREIRIERARNVSPEPRTGFEIDPAALFAAHRRARAGGPPVLGCWHTHPSGDPMPSARDASDAAPDGRLWLIAGAREARLWKAVPSGAVRGRFDPVTFAVAGDGVENVAAAVQGRGSDAGDAAPVPGSLA